LKLEDPDMYVRRNAAAVIGLMTVHSLAKKVADLVSDPSDENGYEYCETLEKLKDPVAVDALVKALGDPKRKLYFVAHDALAAIDDPTASEKVRPLLRNRIAWALASAPEEQRMQYLTIAEVLVDLKDEQSVPVLSDLVTSKSYSELLSRNILNEISKGTKPGELIQDPFILKMRPAVEAAMNHPVRDARSEALRLLCRMPLGKPELRKLIDRGLSDSENWVRISGATCAAEVGYREYADRIKKLAGATNDSFEKHYFCDALQSLGSPCQE
jgi:HEAT repeat protein